MGTLNVFELLHVHIHSQYKLRITDFVVLDACPTIREKFFFTRHYLQHVWILLCEMVLLDTDHHMI